MAEFYIETTAQANGDYIVHKSTCSLLPPSKEAVRYLGAIASSGSAVKKASEFFKQATSCPQCATPTPSA